MSIPASIGPYFYDDIRREFCDDILKCEGDYLVRKAAKTNVFVVSVRFRRQIQHFQPKISGKLCSFGGPYFPDLGDLIKYHCDSKVPLSKDIKAILIRAVTRSSTSYSESDIEIIKKLGEGNFSKVFKVRIKSENRFAAMKTLHEGVKKEVRESFMREFDMMKTMKHENVVMCIGVVEECADNDVKILLELVNKGSLDKLLREAKLTDRGRSRIQLDVARGMQYLHHRLVIHRDLATRNILVQQNPDGSIVGKVSDFGLSQTDESGQGYELKGAEKLPLKWLAPECLLTKKWGLASDVWSFGILMWEVWTNGKDPYSENKNITDATSLKKFISSGGHPIIPNIVVPEVRKIMLACWTVDVRARPNMDKVLADIEKVHSQIRTSSDSSSDPTTSAD